MNSYHSIFISDIHLAAKGCEAGRLLKFLNENECENLFLLGDIIDGWKARVSLMRVLGIRRYQYGIFLDEDQVKVVKKLISLAANGTTIYYILGNHDDFLEDYIDEFLKIDKFTLHKTYDYMTLDGKRLLLLHGHQFDDIMQYQWLSLITDYFYRGLLKMNKYVQRKAINRGYKSPWSFSHWIKSVVKDGLDIVYSTKKKMINYCRDNNYDGVIYGHVHCPFYEVQEDGFVFANTGDWVDSCTALGETHNGELQLIRWGVCDENIIDYRYMVSADKWGGKHVV